MNFAAFDEAGLQLLRHHLQARIGLVFPESREPELKAAVQRTMAATGVADLHRFFAHLDSDERTFDALIANITVGETYFFREPAQFDTLRRRILPDLRRRMGEESKLCVWSAGCASGEEPYSLAILLEQEGLAEQSSILATDVSRTALARAREASYGIWSLRGNPGGTASPHFDRRGDQFVLKDRFRRRVDFRFLNLAAETYPAVAGFDLILCRNVLIYFDQETVQRVARQLFQALRSGGWLITGPSDPPLWNCAPFQTRVTEGGIFYQRDGETVTAATASIPPAASPEAWGWPEPQFHESEAPPAVDADPSPVPDTDSAAWVSEVRMLADRGDAQRAEQTAIEALRAHPLCPDLHYLLGIIHIGLGRHDAAIAALRRVIYLDPSLAIAHFTLGSVLDRVGAEDEARRSYRNALVLSRERPSDEILPLSESEPVRNLVASIEARLKRIAAAGVPL